MKTAILLATALGAACSTAADPGTRVGVGYLRITQQPGTCTVPLDHNGMPAVPTNVDYRRAHATTAFQGGSRWPGGNLVTTAWAEPDGSVARLYVDFSPDRGYGLSQVPSENWAQAVGLTVWQGGVRVFAATQVAGVLRYDASLVRPSTAAGSEPGQLFAHVAFDGLRADGSAECWFVALHASAEHARFEQYDPTWLAANPTSLIVDGREKAAPTFTGDLAPGLKLVAPELAPADPGGVPPKLLFHALSSFAAGTDDPSGSCD